MANQQNVIEERIGKRSGALKKMKDIQGFRILATDGEVGKVDDFYFDDQTWTIRYLVANTGGWLSGKKVLISTEGLEKPDWTNKEFPVKLTKNQVENSPLIETDRPVTRQHQLDLYNYYGWGAPYFVVPTYHAAGAGASVSEVEKAKQREYLEAETNEDPHLRSAKAVRKYDIQAIDGEIGHVQDFILDDEDWGIYYLEVDTRDWLPGKHVLISPQQVKEISFSQEKVHVDLSSGAVKNSPEYDEDASVPKEYEERLRNYYLKTKEHVGR